MKPISNCDMLEAAAYALVSSRCRQAYLHDMRGELQTLHSAVDLMLRATRGPIEHLAAAEKASSLAKRTMANYENSIVQLVDQMAPQFEVPSPVDVGELVSGVLRLVRHDASRKSVALRVQSPPHIRIMAEPHKCRLLLLGIITATVDGLATGSFVDITVERTSKEAIIEINSDMPCVRILDPDDVFQPARALVAPYELLLALAKHWVMANQGRLDLSAGSPLPNSLRISYPISSM